MVSLLYLLVVASFYFFFFFLMIRRPPRSTLDRSSAASDVYKRQMKSIIYAGLTFGFVLFFSVNAIRAADHEWSYKGIMFDEEMREFSVIQIKFKQRQNSTTAVTVSYTHLRAHETVLDLVCRLLLEKKNTKIAINSISQL